ncbi:helix-turn-helix domain-containing protein [uncultured Chitinophaga sp.]|uniref:winged helix-turn-helix transcriptional regulator n=1 Tax=uncultured Chitinophaga sp. TaxID=339340 RepID=UPI0025DBB500|nr:helix-turn-helix domain-containing protein [uncultured Chitinophaga sp.]
MISNYYTEIRLEAHECKRSLNAIDDALYVIGGKWKLRIIATLSDGSHRFNELQRAVKGISARVLSNELKDLELCGLVERRLSAQKPFVAEYILTDYSLTLKDVLASLNGWGAMHRERIKQSLADQQ